MELTVATATLLGMAFGALCTFIIGLFGSREHRDNAMHKAAQEWRVLYEATKKENEDLKQEVETLTETVSSLMKRVNALEANEGIHLFTDKLSR